MDENELSNKIIWAAIEVHKHLGPGLLESAYEECLCHELHLMEIGFERQKNLPVEYKGIKLDCGYRMDLVVDDKVVVEIKAIDKLMPIHEAQVLTYLKLSGLKLGMLINFNNAMIRDGIRRVVLGLRAPLKLVEDEQGSEPEKKP
jgi:GxxExxY protein